MKRYKMARWRRILRRSEIRRRQIRSLRCLRRSPSRLARFSSAVLLTVGWLILPWLPGCNSSTENPAAKRSDSIDAETLPEPQPSSPNPSPQVPPKSPIPSRVIQFRGVDNEYRGSTQVLPNDQLLHRKEEID